MQIGIDNLANGKMDGEIIWVCHYNQPDLNKKALRSVPPTKVLVRSNSELPKNKRIYYAESHLVVLSKNDKPTSKIFGIYDNTGWRSYPGNPLCAFDDMDECVKAWNDQLQVHILQVEEMIKNATAFWIQEKENLVKRKIK